MLVEIRSKYHHTSLALSFRVPLSRQVTLESLQTSSDVSRSVYLIYLCKLQFLSIIITTYYLPSSTSNALPCLSICRS